MSTPKKEQDSLILEQAKSKVITDDDSPFEEIDEFELDQIEIWAILNEISLN